VRKAWQLGNMSACTEGLSPKFLTSDSGHLIHMWVPMFGPCTV